MLRPLRKTSVWLVFIGVHRRSSAANMGFSYSRWTGKKAHLAADQRRITPITLRCCDPAAQVGVAGISTYVAHPPAEGVRHKSGTFYFALTPSNRAQAGSGFRRHSACYRGL
jgi:hypothetical protein